MIFEDRKAAGKLLVTRLRRLELKPPLIVLALPRGGVPVADPVASALNAPLDVMLVRKIGMPGQPELAIGAVASGGIIVNEPRFEATTRAFTRQFDDLAEIQRRELTRREQLFRPGLPPLDLKGQTVILVDDGLATGSTMLAAIRAARKAGAASIIAAAPVASADAVELIKAEADQLSILSVPAQLFAVGQFYEQFDQVEDSEVQRLLAQHQRARC